MYKRPQMKSRLAIATGARRRYFFLTTKRLYYYESNPKGCEVCLLVRIPVSAVGCYVSVFLENWLERSCRFGAR